MVRQDGPVGWRERIRAWARGFQIDAYALYLAARDPRVPWTAKCVAAAVAAYAFSPIDLIPDFVPVLGALDDLIIVPFGIALALRLIPPDIMAECRARREVDSPPHEPRGSGRHHIHMDHPSASRRGHSHP